MANSSRSLPYPTIELNGDEFWPLSGKPFFELILEKSHVDPLYQLDIPDSLHPILPSGSVPLALTFKGRSWEMIYDGDQKAKIFDRTSWAAFVNENNVKEGDGLVFELNECTSTRIEFRVQILRGDIPAELLGKGVNPIDIP